jgi:quercetin dioxygenase-like cupin family protein
MVKEINIKDELSKLKFLEGRTPTTSDAEVNAAFATLSNYDNGGVFTGSYTGESPWERHISGDELVHTLDGETELIILLDDEEEILILKARMLTVVPKGKWHRFKAPNGVTVLSVTPQPTEHSIYDDPRN